MVVKSKRGRTRYIAFSVSPDQRKESLVKSFRSVSANYSPYIIQCTSGKAVIRCSPADREEVVRIMSAADPASVPLMTSGTLRKIRKEYPELKSAKKRNF